MEPQRSSGTGSGNSGTYTAEISESLRFEEEIQSLIHPSFESSPRAGCSFTALLGLPANQAVELLHEPDPGVPPVSAAASSSPTAAELWRVRLGEHAAAAPLRLPFGCSPTSFDCALMERAARFSVFTTQDSPASSSCGGPPPTLKEEPQDSDSPTFLTIPDEKPQRVPKRKGSERKIKAKTPTKARKSAKEYTGGDKLPYVHVRARRGQATDSHSLAERARREKINARMKLLQELVPGCSKITGTTSVLDEIINHVKCLQRQVELLSMRLATVNPRIDFSGLDSFLSTECGSVTAGNGRDMALDPAMWSLEAAAVAYGTRRLPQQQFLQFDLVRPKQSPGLLKRDGAVHRQSHLNPDTSLYVYDWTNTGSASLKEINHFRIGNKYTFAHTKRTANQPANWLAGFAKKNKAMYVWTENWPADLPTF